eukprot:2354133-Prymnesium_polylepis.1
MLAAKAMALVLSAVGSGVTIEAAMAPFPGPLWWEAIATPDDVADEAQFRETLRQLLTESFQLLVPLLAPHAPPACAPLVADPLVYARIVGSFERRNCAVQASAVATPPLVCARAPRVPRALARSRTRTLARSPLRPLPRMSNDH